VTVHLSASALDPSVPQVDAETMKCADTISTNTVSVLLFLSWSERFVRPWVQ
jgi:hypothetical protein